VLLKILLYLAQSLLCALRTDATFNAARFRSRPDFFSWPFALWPVPDSYHDIRVARAHNSPDDQCRRAKLRRHQIYEGWFRRWSTWRTQFLCSFVQSTFQVFAKLAVSRGPVLRTLLRRFSPCPDRLFIVRHDALSFLRKLCTCIVYQSNRPLRVPIFDRLFLNVLCLSSINFAKCMLQNGDKNRGKSQVTRRGTTT
jgi:hypothetical protein